MRPDRRERSTLAITLNIVWLALAMAVLAATGWFVWNAYQRYEALRQRARAIEELVRDFEYFDEVLTMSVKMAALTGDPSWEQRYDAFDERLDTALKKAAEPSPEAFVSGSTDYLAKANQALVVMERRAFSLVRQGARREASELLSSLSYEAYKRAYAAAVRVLASRLMDMQDLALAKFRRQAFVILPASGLISLLLLAVMLGGTLVVKAYVERIKQARDAHEELNRHLEARIAQGTAELRAELAQRQAAEDKLVRAERLAAVGTFTAGIAHQFNNINTAALAYLQILRRNQSPEGLRYVELAGAALDRAVAITSRLMVLSAPPGRAPDPVLVRLVVGAALPPLLPDIERVGATLTVSLEDSRPVRVDRQQLEFVVGELVVNACQSLMEGPRREVRVETAQDEGETLIRVLDTGTGISREDLGRLFTPFFSLKGVHSPSGSAQARVKGVGLGLAVAHAIVAGFGGRIDVASDPGAGSTFTVRLPAAV